MKFTIEVDDFYLEEGELSTELKKYVIEKVVDSIWKDIDKRVESQITLTVKNEIKQKLEMKINSTVENTVLTEKIRIDNKEISLVDYIKEVFVKNTGWSSPVESFKEFAKRFGAEMKQRYDIAFANQIVSKLNENGLLKDEAVAKLLEKPAVK